MEKKRCEWVNPENGPMTRYHDEEWGLPVHDDRLLFEMLILEGAQAGLTWDTVLKKRAGYAKAFCGFDPAKVALITSEREAELLLDPGIVRNRLKIASAVKNARAFLKICEEYGSFDRFIWGYVDYRPIDKAYASIREIPPRDELSDKISKDLKKRGMSFVGSTIICAYLQAIGVVNAHTVDCFRHKEVRP
jgi:DNA-3-methyladenine glycosylase I